VLTWLSVVSIMVAMVDSNSFVKGTKMIADKQKMRLLGSVHLT
jgi:hypothetical protein